jgi:hypothetical protein
MNILSLARAAIATSVLLAFGVAGCSSGVEKYSDEAAALKAKPGKDYHPVFYPGLPGVPNSKPALWTPVQYKQLQWLFAKGCYDSLMPQLAGTKWKSIGIETGKAVIANAFASMADIAPFSPAGKLVKQYAESGAGAGAPSGANYGNTLHTQAVKGDSGQCMGWMVYFAQLDGQLKGVGIVTDYDSVDGNAVPMPNVPDQTPTPAESKDTAEKAALGPPPVVAH